VRRDRDSVVAAGEAANAASVNSRRQKGPWIYKSKVKSGHRSTRNTEMQCTSIPYLLGKIVMQNARDNETLNIYGITRVMKAHLRSIREDI
jgi:hypothetical protein